MTIDDINNAKEEDLTRFTGIGPGIAKRIIDNQPHRNWKEVLEVPYMDEALIEKIKEKDKRPTNPHGANGSVPDPRQAQFLKYYIDPESDTHGNSYRSAMRAGFSKNYASVLSAKMPDWLKEKVSQSDLVSKAFRNLEDFLDEEDDKRLKWKASEFTLERLKREVFGKQVDVTSGGEKLKPELSDKQREEIIKEVIEEYKGRA